LIYRYYKYKEIIIINSIFDWGTSPLPGGDPYPPVKTNQLKINVVTEGTEIGKTYVDPDNGYIVDVALWADYQLFEETLLKILI
jgi:hypothetical protein